MHFADVCMKFTMRVVELEQVIKKQQQQLRQASDKMTKQDGELGKKTMILKRYQQKWDEMREAAKNHAAPPPPSLDAAKKPKPKPPPPLELELQRNAIGSKPDVGSQRAEASAGNSNTS